MLTIEMKVCTKCGIPKSITDSYNKHYASKSGLYPRCKSCQQEDGRMRYNLLSDEYKLREKTKRGKAIEFLNNLKSDPCIDCGVLYKPWQMDFDHLDKLTKNFNVGGMKCFKYGTIIEEISKCDLVCVGCHRDRTHIRTESENNIFIEPSFNFQKPIKICSSCNYPRNLDFFNKRRLKSGYGVYPTCKLCVSKFNKLAYQKRLDYIISVKDNPCVLCGSKFNHWKMDLDHIDQSSKLISVSIACSRGWSLQKIKDEVNKCQLLCCWCHRNKTYEQQVGIND